LQRRALTLSLPQRLAAHRCGRAINPIDAAGDWYLQRRALTLALLKDLPRIGVAEPLTKV